MEQMTKAKKLDLICEKVVQRIEKRLSLDTKAFNGCKTVDEVLLELGSEVWGDVLFEVGYSPYYCNNDVPNLSPRFCVLFDKVVANFDKETLEKIMKLVFHIEE